MILTTSHPDFEKCSKQSLLHRYNGLDCCITLEVYQKMKPLLTPTTNATYQFELSQLPCSLFMTWRGFLIDTTERDKQLVELRKSLEKLERQFSLLTTARCGKPLNHRSNPDLKLLFYSILNLPEQHRYDAKKKTRVVTCNREALEKLDDYWVARPFTKHILAARNLDKIIGVLETGIDADGRLRAAFNPSGTDTGRWSSSENPFRTGTNGQNITGKLRKIFIADKGYRLANGDLEQSESRFVGAYAFNITGRHTYLDACESGDLHTVVAQKLWPHIKNRADADESFYLHFSYRDMAKRGGHGTNYLGTPTTMAQHLKLPTKVMEEFQELYFSEFPEIRDFHQWVATELQSEFSLTTLFNRKRNFWGRATDSDTLRQAVAFLPQSASVDYLSNAMLRIWSDPDLRMIQLLNQAHDALCFQFPTTSEEPAILARVKAHVEHPFFIRGRAITIPFELSCGWNWGKHSKDNPDGLTKPTLSRTRTGQPPENHHRLFNLPRRAGSIPHLGSPERRWRSLGAPGMDGNFRWKNIP